MPPRFVVNPGGAVHSVAPAQAEVLLPQGFRLASPPEIVAWHVAQGLECAAEVADALARGLEDLAAAAERHSARNTEETHGPRDDGGAHHPPAPPRRRSRGR